MQSKIRTITKLWHSWEVHHTIPYYTTPYHTTVKGGGKDTRGYNDNCMHSAGERRVEERILKERLEERKEKRRGEEEVVR